MFEFFIALFGGTYYATKVHKEKSKGVAQDKKNNLFISRMQNDMYLWLEKVTDKKLEDKIDSYINSPDNIVDIYSKMQPIISKMRCFSNVVDIDSFITNVYASPQLIKRALMALHGKIPVKDAEFGMRSPDVYNQHEIYEWNKNHEFMKWLDKELEKHGIEPLVFVNGSDVATVTRTERAQVVNMVTRPIGGVYFWWSGRLHIK